MICHIMGQRLFLGQMRLGLLLSSTNATTYWQKRAGILDKRQTRHVYTTITKSDRPVYGLFIANKLDPNTADAFYKARYWHDWKTTPTPTPVVALETKQIVSLIHRMRSQPLTVANIKELLNSILELQDNCEDGPSWYKSYSGLYETWSASPGDV